MAQAKSTGNAVKFVKPINGSDWRVAKRRKRSAMTTRPAEPWSGKGGRKRKTFKQRNG